MKINHLPALEGLEARRLMSGSTGGLCLPPRPPHSPTPTPIPAPTTGKHHRHHTPAVQSTTSLLLGDWAGVHFTITGDVDATLSVTVTQARSGTLYAKVAFQGPIPFQGTAQLTYSAATSHFSMLVVSPKLVVKFTGSMAPAGREVPQVDGILQSYTRHGVFKGSFALQKPSLPVTTA